MQQLATYHVRIVIKVFSQKYPANFGFYFVPILCILKTSDKKRGTCLKNLAKSDRTILWALMAHLIFKEFFGHFQFIVGLQVSPQGQKKYVFFLTFVIISFRKIHSLFAKISKKQYKILLFLQHAITFLCQCFVIWDKFSTNHYECVRQKLSKKFRKNQKGCCT